MTHHFIFAKVWFADKLKEVLKHAIRTKCEWKNKRSKNIGVFQLFCCKVCCVYSGLVFSSGLCGLVFHSFSRVFLFGELCMRDDLYFLRKKGNISSAAFCPHSNILHMHNEYFFAYRKSFGVGKK